MVDLWALRVYLRSKELSDILDTQHESKAPFKTDHDVRVSNIPSMHPKETQVCVCDIQLPFLISLPPPPPRA